MTNLEEQRRALQRQMEWLLEDVPIKNVLQELRVLINLTHNNEYLHTFILSGQKALWDTLQEMPEFWQRLPVRYYFTPLRFEETRELIRYRLN